jgi:O-antigen/teichoic acid export membrane protein
MMKNSKNEMMQELGKRARVNSLVLLIFSLVPQIFSYGIVVYGARRLNYNDFSDVGTLLNIIMIWSTLALSAQTFFARIKQVQTSKSPLYPAQVLSGLTVASMLIVLTSYLPIQYLTGLDFAQTIPAVLSIPFLVYASGQIGLKQANSNPYLLFFILLMTLRAAGGLFGLAITESLMGLSLGFLVGTILGLVAILGKVERIYFGIPALSRSELKDFMSINYTVLLIYVAVNIDVIWAGRYYTQEDLAKYVIGSTVAKMVFLFPQIFLVKYFSKFTSEDSYGYLKKSLAATSVVISCCLLFVLVFSENLAIAIGGEKYAETGEFLIFSALQGAAFAFFQIVVMYLVAKNRNPSRYQIILILSFMYLISHYIFANIFLVSLSMFGLTALLTLLMAATIVLRKERLV